MGCWGMGITQCDEYCEIYERFMTEYDEGKPLNEIKQDILDEYFELFDENDGIMHDVYFAIGKAEWMCGGISDEMLDKITQIINSGANVAFYRELEATESDLKIRKKNLDKFLNSLTIPRGKTKKRKVPTEKYIRIENPQLPSFKCGDVFAYEIDGKYRALCFVSRGKFCTTYAAYAYVWGRIYNEIPSMEDLMDDYIAPLGYFTVENFPDANQLHYIGNAEKLNKTKMKYPGILFDSWKSATWAIAKEENLTQDLPLSMYRKLSDCLH